jgi:uncharacterized protein YdeI (YjbR/CyaY-like superfamily)
MAPVIVNPDHVHAFKDAAAFEAWLAKHRDTETEIWLRTYKKGSGVESVSNAEALDVVLCWGWIDAIRKGYDDVSFLQRYTPRRPKAIWSQINRVHVERLTNAGRMTAHGQRHIDAAKADGRWEAAYAPAREMEVPDDLLGAIEANPAAYEMFQKLNKQNKFALAFRLGNLKTAATRTKNIAKYVEMLARGETIYPNGKQKAEEL